MTQLPDNNAGVYNACPAKQVLNLEPCNEGWRRPRGAPRICWMDLLWHDFECLGLDISDAPDFATIGRPGLSLLAR